MMLLLLLLQSFTRGKMLSLIVLFAAFISSVRSAEVCCADIGCFTDDAPFDGLPLPMCMDQQNPHYIMYTQSNPGTGELFDHLTVPLLFDPTKRILFIIHGWNSNGESLWLHSMKDALLAQEDANVVIVDWGGGAELANYYQSASNTRAIGAYTALVVDHLITNGGLAQNVWIMGHSLGSHVSGHSGMRSVNNFMRITGLDPAGPWFENQLDRTVGINPSAANFVDIIHTDTQLGSIRDLGHIDFYPAGGATQPGCNRVDVKEGEIPNPQDSCSHSRAYQYMEESITNDCFLAWSKCTDYNDMPASCSACTCGSNPCSKLGYYAMQSCQTSGWFYLDVGATPPYCMN